MGAVSLLAYAWRRRLGRKTLRSLLVAALVVLSASSVAVASPLGAGDTQPDVTVAAYGTGQQLDLYSGFSGKILVFDFFAQWCPHCQAASSELEPDVQQIRRPGR